MIHNPNLHHRRSIRLSGYDYSQEGAYFVTICTQDRMRYFGDVIDGRMVLNDAGRMVTKAVGEIPDKYPGVEIDAFVIMPNHVHVTIVLFDERQLSSSMIGPNMGRARGPAPTDGSFISNESDTGRARGPVRADENQMDEGRARGPSRVDENKSK
jgi:putative transposase